MKQSPIETRIADIITPVVQDQGLILVSVKVMGEGGSKNVQIMAEDPATKRLGVDDCAKLSRAVSAILDVEDPIQGAYKLEVSSPGIDRPLVTFADFETYIGFEAKVETALPTETGQKRFRGTIEAAEDGAITIQTDQGQAQIPFDAISKAKLVLNDTLINQGKTKQENKGQ